MVSGGSDCLLCLAFSAFGTLDIIRVGGWSLPRFFGVIVDGFGPPPPKVWISTIISGYCLDLLYRGSSFPSVRIVPMRYSRWISLRRVVRALISGICLERKTIFC
jgi:hypothetical protein